MNRYIDRKKISYFLVLIIFCLQSITAQIVNIGEVTIMPNTQISLIGSFENANTGNFFNDGELFVYGDFENNGVLAYANTGSIRFVGSNPQSIFGNEEMFFYDVVFSNSQNLGDTFQLSGQITVENNAEFVNGIVNNRDFGGMFRFASLANQFGTNNSSYVDGTIIKIGNSSFSFPTGNGGYYRPALITAPSQIQDQFESTYFFKNSNTTATPHDLKAGAIERIDNTEYWLIERTEGNSEVFVSLSWDIDTTPTFITQADKDLIHIARWDEAQGFWVDEGGIVDVANNTVTTFSKNINYGIYTLSVIKPNIEQPDNLIVYNALTPNRDGKNDFFFIDGIDQYPNNSVRIFNRNGVEVFNTRGYNESDNVFRGYSDGRLTINRSEQLPTGTYFYILEYEFPGSVNTPVQQVRKAGYLYINSDN